MKPEVVQEFQQENEVPKNSHAARAALGGEPSMPGGLAGAVLDLDLSQVALDAEQADGMTRQIASLTADQRGDQLQRLERSLLRLERINVQTLSMLQQLVQAVKKPGDGGKP